MCYQKIPTKTFQLGVDGGWVTQEDLHFTAADGGTSKLLVREFSTALSKK